eukprot:848759_1
MDADVSCVGLASVPQYGALPCHVPYNMPQMHPIPVFPFSTSQSGQRSFNPSLPPPNINRCTNDQYIACDTNGHAMWNGNAQVTSATQGTRISDSLMQMSNHTPSAHFATPSMQPMFHGHQGPRMHPMPMSFSKQNQSQSIAVKTEAASKNELYDDVPAIDTLAILDSFVCDSQWAMDHALPEETLFPFGTPDQDCMNNSMESGGFGGGSSDKKRPLSSPDSSISPPSKKARL